MPLEPPARIAVLGAGPVGLEAALYARFLGYQVDIFERGSSVAENVREWGHVRMFSPFGMNASPLGIAAIEAQEPAWSRPAEGDLLTGQEFINRYVAFLAQTDLIVDSLHWNTRVLAVGRDGLLKGELNAERAEAPFRILTETADGVEGLWTADAVCDTTGTFGNSNWLGPGGIPALGERAAAPQIEYGLPDVLGLDRRRYAGRHTLLVGAGYSAATCVVGLAELARQEPSTRLTWLTRRPVVCCNGPISAIPQDRLEARRILAETANALAREGRGVVSHLAGASIEQIAFDKAAKRFAVSLGGADATELAIDRIVANVGYRPDIDIYRELQVHTCYASEGPMKLAAAMLRQASGDCLDQVSRGPESLTSPEPNFFILGSKSYGRGSTFLLSVGHQQIRDAFAIFSGNPDLDVYRTVGYRRNAGA